MGFFDQNNLLGVGGPTQMPQPAPQLVPQQPAPMAAPEIAQAQTGYHSPTLIDPTQYFNSGNTVAASSDRQAKLGEAFDKLLKSAIDGPSDTHQRQARGAKIFNGAASVLGGLLGGGYAQGGTDLLKQTEQTVQDARNERRQRYSDAISGLGSLTNIINATSPDSRTAFAGRLKSITDYNNTQVKDAGNGLKAQRYGDLKKIAEDKQQSVDKHNQLMADLKKAGLQLDYTKLETHTKLENAKIAAARQLQQIEEAGKNGRANQEMAMRAQQLSTNITKWNAEQGRLAQQFDADMEAKLGKRNAAGELEYKGVKVPKLFGNVGADFDLSGLNASPEDNAAIEEANRLVGAVPQVAAPQAPALPDTGAPQQQAQGPQTANGAAPNAPSDAAFNTGLAMYNGAKTSAAKVQAKQQWIQALQNRYGMSPQDALTYLSSKGVK